VNGHLAPDVRLTAPLAAKRFVLPIPAVGIEARSFGSLETPDEIETIRFARGVFVADQIASSCLL
jgi:hypothetical protein